MKLAFAAGQDVCLTGEQPVIHCLHKTRLYSKGQMPILCRGQNSFVKRHRRGQSNPRTMLSYWDAKNEINIASSETCSTSHRISGSVCNWLWASHGSVFLDLTPLQGNSGVRMSPGKEILFMCFTCSFPEELLQDVSDSLPSYFVPFRRNSIPPVKCSSSACAVHVLGVLT